MAAYRSIIESVGIELEFSNINRDRREFVNNIRRNLPGFQIKHDASCETPIYTLGGIPVINGEESEDWYEFMNREIIGGEIASPVINSVSPEWVQHIYSMCEILSNFGEDESSLRDSFHVHVNISKEAPLFTLKNLLTLSTAYEAIIFRLGGMGRINRGQENQYIYQRPYLGNGPPVISNDGRNYPILSVDDLFAAETAEDFFHRYGNSLWCNRERKRYVTQRYMVTNFYSILNLGSFEFRTSNKTLNPEYIIAWTNFCKSFVHRAFSSSNLAEEIDFQYPLYENREISYDEFLDKLRFFNSLDDSSRDTLLEIWQESPTPSFDNLWRYSHLRSPTKFGMDYQTKPIEEEVYEADFLDIHHFEDRERIEIGGRVFGRLPRNRNFEAPVVNAIIDISAYNEVNPRFFDHDVVTNPDGPFRMDIRVDDDRRDTMNIMEDIPPQIVRRYHWQFPTHWREINFDVGFMNSPDNNVHYLSMENAEFGFTFQINSNVINIWEEVSHCVQWLREEGII